MCFLQYFNTFFVNFEWSRSFFDPISFWARLIVHGVLKWFCIWTIHSSGSFMVKRQKHVVSFFHSTLSRHDAKLDAYGKEIECRHISILFVGELLRCLIFTIRPVLSGDLDLTYLNTSWRTNDICILYWRQNCRLI